MVSLDWQELLQDTVDDLSAEVVRCHRAIRGVLAGCPEFPCMWCGYVFAHREDCPWIPLWAIYNEESRPEPVAHG